MGEPLAGPNAALSAALHALVYALGRADAQRRGKPPYSDGSTQRAFSRKAIEEYIATVTLPYKDIDDLAVSYGKGYRDQYEQMKQHG